MTREQALARLEAEIHAVDPSRTALKACIEEAFSAGASREQVAAIFPSPEAWRRFTRYVSRRLGGFTEPGSDVGLAIDGKMWPLDVSDPSGPLNEAARAELQRVRRAWGVVWSFPNRISEPSDIGACGMRTRIGFFTAEPPASGTVVQKYQPHND